MYQKTIKREKMSKVSKTPLSDISTSLSSFNNKTIRKNKSKKRLKSNYPVPRSYRLDHNDIDILKETTEEISEISGKMKITDTLIIKALLRLSMEINPEEILNKIKEVKAEV